MSADAPRFGDTQQSTAPPTSADLEPSQPAYTVNGTSLKNSIVDSEVSQLVPRPLQACFPGVSLTNFSGAGRTIYSAVTGPNILPDTAAAMNTISNHPVTQNTKETLSKGMVVMESTP